MTGSWADLTGLRARTDRVLADFLTRQRDRMDSLTGQVTGGPVGGTGDVVGGDDRPADGDDEVAGLIADTLATFLRGGKRLRPAFAYWGYRGAGGEDSDALVTALASLELVQASALIHDDVMDGSDTRRGVPAVHRRFAGYHRSRGWRGDPDQFGTAAAILLGDLCLVWSDELLHTSGLPGAALTRARPVFDQMRGVVTLGQYLDVLTQSRGDPSTGQATLVARLKSAKYTVEHPLLLGAALAGAPPAVGEAYSGYGLPLGEAFQLRDDVLGVFGDPTVTGKPAGDDLRAGKRTYLVAAAFETAAPAARAALAAGLGDPDLDEAGVHRLRGIIVDTGALDRTERRIRELTDAALAALADGPLVPAAADALRGLAAAATARSR